MLVYKFGGTSVGSAQNIQRVAEIIRSGEKKIVVLSAMSGVTDMLVHVCELLYRREVSQAFEQIDVVVNRFKSVASELFASAYSAIDFNTLLGSEFLELKGLINNEMNHVKENTILSFGERLTTKLFFSYLNELAIDLRLISSLDFMRKDKKGEPDYAYIRERLLWEIESNNSNIIICQGFICRDFNGEVDTFGRGGSDYSATIIGAAINASEIQIWSDKDGLLNNDPRYVEQTFPLEFISYEEAEELAYFGAKILHPTCIQPAKRAQIPILLKNTFNPRCPGTIINYYTSSGFDVKAIAAKDNITAIQIQSARMLNAVGFLRKVFEVFERHNTPIDMITTSEVAISVTIDKDSNLPFIMEELESFGHVDLAREQTIVCIVGNFSAEKKGLSAQIFQSLKNIPLRMISYGASKRNLTVLVNGTDKIETLNVLNSHLFKEKLCTIEI